MKLIDLPSDASPELRAIHQANEHISRLAVFLTEGLADLEVMLMVQRDMLKQVLVNQGADADELQRALDERAVKWRETSRKLLMSRWTLLVQSQEALVDDKAQQD